jgi:hypothetical protein
MITEKELRRVNELNEKKHRITSLLRSIQSEHVWARIGIVDINSASTHDPNPSEHAEFFHNQMKHLVDEFTEEVVTRLNHEVKNIDNELSQYVKKCG